MPEHRVSGWPFHNEALLQFTVPVDLPLSPFNYRQRSHGG